MEAISDLINGFVIAKYPFLALFGMVTWAYWPPLNLSGEEEED